MLSGNVIAFIGGGNMAEAIISGLIRKKIAQPEMIIVSEKNPMRRDYIHNSFGVSVLDNNIEAVKSGDIIILAVKPQNYKDISDEILNSGLYVKQDKIIISILAGTLISKIEETFGTSSKVIRVMPNTPALIGKGIAAISKGKNADCNDLKIAQHIFNQLGKTIIVDETDMDLVTALSGSGPAYVFYFIEALIESAVKLGMDHKMAEMLVYETFSGAVELLINSGLSEVELRKKVTSKGGTTERGISVFENHNLKNIVFKVVNEAMLRSVELSRNE